MPYKQVHKRFYTDVVNLHAPIKSAPDPVTKKASDIRYDFATPTIVQVKCRFVSTPEVDVPSIGGLQKEVNIFTLDRFHFYSSMIPAEFDNIARAGRTIANTWYIHFLTPNHPAYGRWWVVEGNPLQKMIMCYAEVFAKQTTVKTS